MQLLEQRDVKLLLDQVEIDQQKELISKGYFLANKNELAIKYGSEALDKICLKSPLCSMDCRISFLALKTLWQEAANYFSLFSISLKNDAWHQTSGSFWAARSYAKLGQYDKINFWLKRASNNPNSFYGMLAMEILGIKDKINWQTSKKINQKNNVAYLNCLLD